MGDPIGLPYSPLAGSHRVRAVALVGCGFLLGIAVSASAFADAAGVAGNAYILLWSGLAVSLTTSSAVVFELGLRRLHDLARVRPVRWGPTIWLGTILVTAVALMAAATLLLDLPGVSWRGLVLTVWAVAGAGPIVIALLGIRSPVRSGPLSSDLGARTDEYLQLRELNLGLLPPLGALVALSTFALGAAGQLGTGAGAAPVTDIIVLFFGATGTLLVGCVYAVPRQALRGEGRDLLRALAPVIAPDAKAARAELAQRQTTESQLGLNTTLLDDLRSGVIILGPLLVSATTLLLTSR